MHGLADKKNFVSKNNILAGLHYMHGFTLKVELYNSDRGFYIELYHVQAYMTFPLLEICR